MISNDSTSIKVTFFYQYFWPDSPPYASMLRSMGREFCENGVDVSVITGKPSYKTTDRMNECPDNETVDGILVKRLSPLWGSRKINFLRLLQKALFPFRAFLFLVYSRWVNKEKPGVIIAATIPPVVNGLFALLAARMTGAKFIYHMQDIYPEIGVVGGIWSEDSIRYRVLKRLDVWICRKAEFCVVLSEDMRNTLVARGVDETKIIIINNFLLESHVDETETAPLQVKSSISDQIHIVFAGNLGRFQRLDVILRGFLRWCSKRVESSEPISMSLHFLGDGIVKDDLIELAGASEHVHFHGHVAFTEASKFIEKCEAGIVSLEDNVFKYAYPSKTLTYLGLGTPVLALIEGESGLAQDISNNELGVVCDHRDEQGVSDALDRLYNGVISGKLTREKTLEFYKNYQVRDVVFRKWNDLVKSIEL